MDQTSLSNLLQPKSVAIVGASTQPGKIGYTVIENLLKGGYQGQIYPINPTASEILGLKIYPNIAAAPGKVDLAVITVPVKLVCQVVEECGQKGIKALSVITSKRKCSASPASMACASWDPTSWVHCPIQTS